MYPKSSRANEVLEQKMLNLKGARVLEPKDEIDLAERIASFFGVSS